MSVKIAAKLVNMKPYDPIEDIVPIHLDANESPFGVPDDIKNKVLSAVAGTQFNRYPDPASKSLRKAAAERFGVSPSMVIAGNGSDELISLIVSSCCEKGGRMLVTEPEFSMYRFYASIAESESFAVTKDSDGKITADAIIEAAQSYRPDILIFSNPCNPTGQGLARGDVMRIIKDSGCLVVVDEAYMDFWDQSVLTEAVKEENAIVLKTCSKALGFAGARVGFAISNEYITSLLNRARSPYNVNSMSQAAATALLYEKDFLAELTKRILVSKRGLERRLTELSEKYPDRLRILPTVTNFCVIESPLAEKLFKSLLERGIAVRYFAKTGTLRVTAGTDEENAAFEKALYELIQK